MWSKYCSALKKGGWTEEEDTLLKRCIEKHGEGKWQKVPLRAGLNRCHRSCRIRWLNYLHPNLKREEFSWDEINLIIQMQKLLGHRWSLIAARLPGRTANDIKNQWTNHIYKSLQKKQQTAETSTTTQCSELHNNEKSSLEFEKEHSMEWWENLLVDEEAENINSSSSSWSKEHSMLEWLEYLLLGEDEADGKAENINSGSKDKFSFDSFPSIWT